MRRHAAHATTFLLTSLREPPGAAVGDGAAISAAGMSAVRAVSSAYVRDASTPPARTDSSSLPSRPYRSALFTPPTPCSGSVSEARRRPRPAIPALFRCRGPAITSCLLDSVCLPAQLQKPNPAAVSGSSRLDIETGAH